jgi:hypothetical protein
VSGADLTRWIQEHGLSRRALARTIGRDVRAVRRWERRAVLDDLVQLALPAALARVKRARRMAAVRERRRREAWGLELERRDRAPRELSARVERAKAEQANRGLHW